MYKPVFSKEGGKLYFENLMALHIAIKKKCSVETAFKWLDKYLENRNLDKRTYHTWTDEDLEDVKAFKKEGLSYEEIGEYYGTNKEAVYRAYKRREAKEVKL